MFKLSTDGTGYAVLKSFAGSDGALASADLVVGGSTLYGTAWSGGSLHGGVVFKVNTDGTGYTVLKTFTGGPFDVANDGALPGAGLVLGDSTLYGTTSWGGAPAFDGSVGCGVIFKLNTDGTGYTVLKEFSGSDGSNSVAGLVLAGNTLYGTTSGGGSSGNGVVFKVNTDGTGYTVLWSFSGSDGANPRAGLVLAGNTLYGTTFSGGIGYGVVFQVNTDGSGYTVLKTLTTADGTNPQTDLLFSGATLFGGTSYGTWNGGGGPGTLFSVSFAPALLEAPLSQTVVSGTNVQFTAQGTGMPAVAYQWYFNGRSAILGATEASLSLNNVQRSKSGAYTVVVTNQFGAVTSAPAVLDVLAVAPRVETAPLSQTNAVGSNAVFSVAASGSLPLSYQWYFNGTHAIHGAVNPSLLLTNLQLAQAGAYTVVVANPVGKVTSSPAKLTVYGLAPTIMSSPSGYRVEEGATAEAERGRRRLSTAHLPMVRRRDQSDCRRNQLCSAPDQYPAFPDRRLQRARGQSVRSSDQCGGPAHGLWRGADDRLTSLGLPG